MKDGTCKRYKMDGDSLTHESAWKHAKEWISDVKYSPDDTKICIGSHDNGIYGYDQKDSGKLVKWRPKM